MRDMYESNVFLDEVWQHFHTYEELLKAGPDEETLESREVFQRLKSRMEGEEEDRGGYALLGGLRRQGPKELNTLIHGKESFNYID